MAWRKSKTKLNESSKLNEASRQKQLDITSLLNEPFYQFTSQLTGLRSNLNITSTVKQAMLKDPLVTQVIDMWISDTLSSDILSGKIFDVEIKDNHSNDPNINVTIESAKKDIDYLLENSNLEEQLTPLLYRIITMGIASVRLGFVDLYEDTKIKLFESNKRIITSNKEKLTEKDGSNFKLLEAPTYDDYEDETEGYLLKARRKIPRALGRFYFELLPQRLVPLKHKGITILYLDLNNALKVLNPRNITTFANTRGGVKTLSLKENPDDIDSMIYEVPLGKSFIDQAVTPWSMYNTSQDCTILALMTRASIYRLFQIDVGAMSVEDTERFLQEFKKKLTTRESIDVRSQHYSSAQTQIPLGDSILIPTRNGLGKMEVSAIGGDLNIQTEGSMEFFREELLAALGIPKELIYGSENGSLINTSATRSDIRYLRTIQRFVSILSLGLESIFKDYLSMLDYDLSNLSVKVIFKQLNSEEALQKIEYEQTKQDALDKVISSLNSLGISFDNGRYQNTRDELIRRYLDSDILDFIKKDEKEQPIIEDEPIEDEPTEDVDNDFDIPSSMSSVSSPNVGSMEVPNQEETTEDTTPTVEPSPSTQTNEEPPYSLG